VFTGKLQASGQCVRRGNSARPFEPEARSQAFMKQLDASGNVTLLSCERGEERAAAHVRLAG